MSFVDRDIVTAISGGGGDGASAECLSGPLLVPFSFFFFVIFSVLFYRCRATSFVQVCASSYTTFGTYSGVAVCYGFGTCRRGIRLWFYWGAMGIPRVIGVNGQSRGTQPFNVTRCTTDGVSMFVVSLFGGVGWQAV